MIESKEKPLDSLNIAIIDADNIPFYCCYNKEGLPEKTYEECIQYTDNYMKFLLENTKSEQYICCFTIGKNTFRNILDKNYKANRKYAKAIVHGREIRKYLIDNYNGIYNEYYEADDLVLSLNRSIPNSFIISPDKDILTTSGYRYNPKKNVWVHSAINEELYFFWKSMVKGDSADNISGIKGHGEASAQSHISSNKFEDIPGSILNTYVKVYGNYNGIEEFYRNYKLLKIVDNIYINKELPKLRKVNYLSFDNEISDRIS